MARDYNYVIGDKICNLRKRAGMTQSELAEKADLSVPFLSEIENGRKSMSVNTLLALSKALKVSTDFIINEYEYEDNLLEGVLSCMAELPREYNESLLVIARELLRTSQREKEKAEKDNRKKFKRYGDRIDK